MAASAEDLRKWLNVTLFRWGTLEEHEVSQRIFLAMQPLMDLAARVRQAQFAFEFLYQQDRDKVLDSLGTFAAKIEDIRSVVAKVLRKKDPMKLLRVLETRQADVQDLLNRFDAAEGESVGTIVASMGMTRTARLSTFVSENPQITTARWENAKPGVEQIWGSYFRLALRELETIEADVKVAAKAPQERLHEAAMKISGPLQHHIKDLAVRVAERSKVRLGTYLDEVQSADTKTAKFILSNLCSEVPELRDFRDGQDPRNPVVYVAKLADPVILQALNRFMVRDQRGRYTYRVYRFGPDTAILYDGYMLARYASLLDEISDGRIFHAKEARKLFTARTMLRCTFTSNAKQNRAFMDYLRALGANKIGPSTWDIPIEHSWDLETLKTTFKQDFGYPIVYEEVDNVGFPFEIANSDGIMYSALVRYAMVPPDAFVRKEQHGRRTAWVLRSQDTRWCGGWASSAKKAQARLQALQERPVRRDPVIARDAQVRLRKAASLHRGLQGRLNDLAENLEVVAHWVVGHSMTRDTFHDLSMPRPGSRVRIGSRVLVVGEALEGRGWFTASEGAKPYVVMRPDIYGHGALLDPALYERLKHQRSLGPVTGVEFQPGMDMFHVPTLVILLDTDGSGHAVEANSPMGGTENWNIWFPDGFTFTLAPQDPNVLYYPTSDQLPGPPVDPSPYQQAPDSPREELPTEQLTVNVDHRPLDLYPDGSGQQPVQKPFGPHPGNSFNTGTQPGDGPQHPLPYDPFFPLRKAL